jgi:aryl-alcohol dehydrogenase-like predicted oxidoreductase
VQGGEWLEALDQLRQDGKVRYYGISCDSLDAAAAALDHPRVSAIQVPINLLEPEFADVLPRAREQGVAVIARECLSNGLLAKEASAADIEACSQSPSAAALKGARLELCRQAATENGCMLSTLALKFVSRLDGVSVSLVGASRPVQLQGLLAGGFTSADLPELRGIPRWA